MLDTHSLKVGDRVIYDNFDGRGVPTRVGKSGVVTKVHSCYSLDVQWDDGHHGYHVVEYIKPAPKKTKRFTKGDRVQWRDDKLSNSGTFDGTVLGQNGDTVEVVFDDFATQQFHPSRNIHLITPAPEDKPAAPKGKFYVVPATGRYYDTEAEASEAAARNLKESPGYAFVVAKGLTQYETNNVIVEIELA